MAVSEMPSAPPCIGNSRNKLKNIEKSAFPAQRYLTSESRAAANHSFTIQREVRKNGGFAPLLLSMNAAPYSFLKGWVRISRCRIVSSSGR